MSSAMDYLRRTGSAVVEVPADVLDIGRRIQQGDELWRGDPNMELLYDDMQDVYVIVAHDSTGHPYVVLERPYCDQRLLEELTMSDWQNGSRALIERLVKQENAAQKAKDDAWSDMAGEIGEKLAWAVKRTFATHLGGRSNTYSMNTGRN